MGKKRLPAAVPETLSEAARKGDSGPAFDAQVAGEFDDLDASDLMDLALAQRSAIEHLSRGEPFEAKQAGVQEKLLRFLLHEVRRRSAKTAPDPRPHLQAAAELADLFQIEVPSSHRKNLLGNAATWTKRAVIRGFKPLHHEMLRPQQAFNREFAEVLGRVAGAAPTGDGSLAAWAAARLEPLCDPARWQVSSHREWPAGRAANAVKRAYLETIGPLVGPFHLRQREWNEAATRAVLLAARWDFSGLSEAHRLLGRLKRLEALPSPATLRGGARLSSALWIELFRRQEAFNAEADRALRAFFNIPLAGDDGGAGTYQAWMADREVTEVAEAKAKLALVAHRPLLSLITPVHDTPEPVLRAALDSVLAQSYDRWELCLVDDGSKQPHIARVLAEYAARDKRFKVHHLPRNAGIALATNAALELATGKFVCFLDHDDALTEHALAEVVLWLDRSPDADVLYSDEDRLDLRGRRLLPFFKPDWSPDLLRAVNYVCHFLVVRRSLVTELGGLRAGFDGAQDYDLILRLSEKTDRISHIPKILYHWRATPTSTAASIANKPNASAAGQQALRDHLRRCHEPAKVDAWAPTMYRVRYQVKGEPRVSIVVPVKSGPAGAARLVQNVVEQTGYPNFEVSLVAPREAYDALAGLSSQDPRIQRLRWDRPFDAPAMSNHGARNSRGELLLFLHDDLEVVDPAWLEELIGHAQRKEVGAVAPKLLYPDGTILHAGVVVGADGVIRHPFAHMADAGEWTTLGSANWTRNYLAVTGACLMVRREAFEAAGGFDEKLLGGGWDVDFCLRLVKRGLRIVYTPHTRLVTLDALELRDAPGGAPSSRLSAKDPFYNPNLSSRVANGRLGKATDVLPLPSAPDREPGEGGISPAEWLTLSR